MSAPLHTSYTNEVNAEFLCRLDNSPFTQQQLAGLDGQTLAIVSQQRTYQKAHPPIAIYRVATEGSQTREGGVIQQGTSPLELTSANGQPVRAAQKGDHVVYADGSTAQIITAAGESNSHVALVGSCLSNGDEIINTCQDVMLLIAREGVPMAEDFLPGFKQTPTVHDAKGHIR